MLDDVTIAEVGDSLATAYCGRLLADAGANVIRIVAEQPTKLSLDDPDYASYLYSGKRTVNVDQDLRENLSRLASDIDVAICDDDKTWKALRNIRQEFNPKLILIGITDYGLTGPDADTPATDLTLQAEAGIAVMHASLTSPPLACGIPLSELAGGMHAAVGTVQGLLARDAGGVAIEVDVSRFESLVWLLTFPWNWEQVDGHAEYSVPVDGHAPFVPPMNALPEICPARDGWVCLSANTPPHWSKLKEMVQVPELNDPRFDQVATRSQYAAEVVPLLHGYTSRHTVDELIELAQQYRVPAAPVVTPDSAYRLPPYAERGSTVLDETASYLRPRPVFRFSGDQINRGDHAAVRELARGDDASSIPGATPSQPLKGLRVVAFEVFHAGPLASEYLCGLGAEVIKVEAVNRPDLIRFAGMSHKVDHAWERSATFIALNLGKHSITADLSEPTGMEIIRRLLTTADLVLDSFVPSTLDTRDLGYDKLREIRPDVAMIRMPGWGLAGAWANRPAYTQLVESASGTASLTGQEGEAPRLTGTIFDPMSSLFAVFAALIALRRRQHTGQGCLAEVALCDTALQFTTSAMIRASRGKPPLSRNGNRSRKLAPQGIYRCQDGGWIALSIADDKRWEALNDVIGASWTADRKFASLSGRLEHHDELDALLEHFCSNHATNELVRTLRNAGIASAPLGVGGELIRHPQLHSRGRVFRAPHPFVGEMAYVGYPAKMSTLEKLPDTAAAPTLGKDNARVLAELGYSADEIAVLQRVGAIGSIPYAKVNAK